MKVIQIVPRLLAPTDGVANYATRLANALSQQQGITTHFISADLSETRALSGELTVLRRRSADEFVAAVEASIDGYTRPVALLHYVNYGYARRGCPFWLLTGLEQLRRRRRELRIATIFHELYASGGLVTSAFWLSRVQLYLAKRALRASDAAIASLPLVASYLRSWRPSQDTPILVMPVFSNVPEPDAVRAWNDRNSAMVVFGRSGIETRVYGEYLDVLAKACRQLGITEIIDIGPRTTSVPASVAGIAVRVRGFQEPHAVSELLAGARAGFVDYSSDVLEKSTVFAAYASHAVLPVISQYKSVFMSSLQEGRHYWAPTREMVRSLDLHEIGGQARSWYEDHSLKVQAGRLAEVIGAARARAPVG